MFSRFFRRAKSESVATCLQVEALEGRRFLSASSIAADVLDVDDSQTLIPQAASDLAVAASAPKLVKIEGAYSGHYTSKVNSHVGTNTLSFNITHYTHTGHFTGTATIHTHTSGTLVGNLTGVVHTNKHVSISDIGNKFSVAFVGIASHTGGSINGSYSTVVDGAGDTGTFHVGKT